MLRAVAGWALIAFLAYYLITDPIGAAGFIHSLLGGLQSAGNKLSMFANHL